LILNYLSFPSSPTLPYVFQQQKNAFFNNINHYFNTSHPLKTIKALG
jgi:hypothetical protein